jgi:hypothetical protein
MAKKKLTELTEKTILHKDDLFYLVDSEATTGKGKKVKWGTLRPYKVYTALLTQSGEAAPVATVLENTLGGTVVWARDDTGVYVATLSGAFTNNKTFIYCYNASAAFVFAIRLNADTISISTYFPDSDTPADGKLSANPIEIRVYN